MVIRNIWAIGRNYADHARELNNEVPTEPLIFLKAGSCASVNSPELVLPWWTEEVHHEVELALKISSHMHFIEGALALDLTERKKQSAAKAKGLPWTWAKSFEGACAVSSFFSLRKMESLSDLRLRLWVNDELRQDGRTSQMIFTPDKILEHLKTYFPLCPGDLVLTGTPSGVGPLQDGDVVRAEIEGELTHTWRVKKQPPPPEKS